MTVFPISKFNQLLIFRWEWKTFSILCLKNCQLLNPTNMENTCYSYCLFSLLKYPNSEKVTQYIYFLFSIFYVIKTLPLSSSNSKVPNIASRQKWHCKLKRIFKQVIRSVNWSVQYQIFRNRDNQFANIILTTSIKIQSTNWHP